jgi:hypothetical protein
MNNDQICCWLGLPAGKWPPDHYTLLGLKPGEGDIACIEQHVHDRLAKLRCYQLSHPEQVTEAMNRVAQAFMCLTDPAAKRAYDGPASGKADVARKPEANGGLPRKKAAVAPEVIATARLPVPASLDDTDVALRAKTQVDWKQAPPPIRAPVEKSDESRTDWKAVPPREAPDASPTPAPEPPAEAAAASPLPATETPETVTDPAALPISQPADVVYQTAYASPEARRGLGTVQKVIDRVYATRQLLWAWEQAGKYLNKPKRRLTRTGEQNELYRRLREIEELMDLFPRILGQPGQPGYRVIAMARLEMATDMFNMLDPVQRAALARDWLAGRVLLLEHRRYLRHELKILRRQNWLKRVVRAARAMINDHPAWVLLGLAGVGGLVALTYVFYFNR